MSFKEFYNLKLNIMKKPIAMKCNQEQFDAVKEKLGKEKIINLTSFDNCKYLTNAFRGVPGNISNIGKPGLYYFAREIHETWNEKVFLEACGIEVEEQKEESFVITKEQILELSSRTVTNKELLCEYFPKAFEPEKKELVVGKWYKKTDFGKFKFCFNGSYRQMSQYGFDRNGYWSKELGIYEYEEYIEATQQEVEEALKAEILKRYKVGDLVYLWYSEGKTKKLLLDEFKYCPKDNQMFVSTEENRMAKMFNKGIFAEIIQPKKMTKAEAEIMYNIEIL